MRYYYRCGKKRDECCKLADAPNQVFEENTVVLPERIVDRDEEGNINESTTPIILEIHHGMSETPEIKCPVCEHECIRVIAKSVTAYFRGYGYLDKKGCYRDMNLYKLQTDDPYGYMRQPGEAEFMADQIKKKGKFDPKPKHFVPRSDGSGFTRKDNTIND